jgi:chemosensory pili system protein ChpA (sensor histidine kinase/response regulator)
VLLLRSGAEAAAVLVDEMIGNQEVVVKDLGPQLARVPGVAGVTVLGSGEIVLILNPVALILRPRPQQGHVTTQVSAPAAARLKVMVVDDSLTVRKITGRLLEREGYQVLTAKDGVEALEQLSETVPDVMLVDIEMPRMDGFDLTRNVRADPRLKSVPIIMITSRTADKHRAYAQEVGANAFLGKPYQEEQLLGQIAGFVGRRLNGA